MKKLVVFTGAGISAESGLQTFRDKDGLWEGYNSDEVATAQAWKANPDIVQKFFNMRRKDILLAQPNQAHYGLAQLQENFDVTIITQNIDDLHERAGSKHVIHLHGNIRYAQSSIDPTLVYPVNGWEIKMRTYCEKGSQLRPHVVLFGEHVPNIYLAEDICSTAEIFAVIGTKLAVPPASGIVHFVPKEIPKYVIDPKPPYIRGGSLVRKLVFPATIGVPLMIEELLSDYLGFNGD